MVILLKVKNQSKENYILNHSYTQTKQSENCHKPKNKNKK
jgi:hypothetical protein